ncbi:MAG: hypothetical protein HOW97_02330 [Catenulispora sp.]|nr:hypothetical protein [Catenulispora sp.]
MSEIPDEVVQAQRVVDAAWAELAAFRKAVDADRRKTAQPPGERHGLPVLRPWTDAEDARYAELHAAVVAASEARADAMRAAGIESTWDTERAIRAAARAGGE